MIRKITSLSIKIIIANKNRLINKIQMFDFDVIVIGGGHAGIEAACASARIGAKTALITMKFDNLGEMSCNPAIGGIGKGTIVREIDALDGIMGRCADLSSIHSKILNESKGEAVWGMRAQIDRELYKKAVQNELRNYKNLTVIEGEVVSVESENSPSPVGEGRGEVNEDFEYKISLFCKDNHSLNILEIFNNKNLHKAKELRNNMTQAETTMWNKIRAKRLNDLKFKRQVPIGNYIVDFVCLEAKLIIELDGGQHANEDIYNNDLERTRYLESYGFKIIRFWNNEILKNLDQCLNKILETMEKSKSQPLLQERELGRGYIITLSNSQFLSCRSIVITTGTFLRGMIHRGTQITPAGRINEKPSNQLSQSLEKMGIKLYRMKTGTPARIYRDSIDFSELEKQFGDNPPRSFSYMTDKIDVEQIPCHITYTNQKTHDIINAAREQSPIDNGQISSRGPRYCPSIEDKVRRFAHHDRHQIFLEPEGLNNDLIYPNGISTAMPVEIQDRFIHTIKGLENCKIAQFGYAIEYDYIDSKTLRKTLEIKNHDGLFFAGQINGTTGYEEAAGQGLIAGVNAGLRAINNHNQQFILDRTSSYIGVMIDDLTNLGVNGEPYRMFTSRSEYRLSIRADNADQRLTDLFEDLISPQRMKKFTEKIGKISKLRKILESEKITPARLQGEYNIKIAQDGIKRNLFELLCNKNITFEDIAIINDKICHFDEEVKNAIQIEAKYFFYIQRQKEEIENLKKNIKIKIPDDINYKKIHSLSNEIIEKLNLHRPETIDDMTKIPGITPAAVMAVIGYLQN